ncbi:hypothetical protein [Streptomyces sparsogenes]|uniref:hypothetical protein n=1 Tax=Streptomyces sparsogenes TaxID=67365 RepID=UPI001FDFC8DE|nr:hypothetical protein [Streptomyces sparsogenes]
MSPVLSRVAGVVTLVVALATVVWLAFGAPSDWEGGIRWLRHGLVLGCLGLFTLSARLIFPATREDAPDPMSD